MSLQRITKRDNMQPENSSKAIHCGLCLKIISYTNSEVLKIVKEVLEIVLPNLILEKKNEHRMCKPCWSKLFAAYIFKVTCIDIENMIFSHVSIDKESAIELKEVYLKVNGNIELTDKWEEQKVCRLCLQLVTSDFMSFNEVDNDIIDTYIPHVKIDATKNPVICAACFNSLRTHGSFLINCLKAHDKFKSADKQPDIKCEIELEDGPDLQMIYKNIEEQFYIKSEEIEIKMEGDQDNDISSYKLGEEIIKNKRNNVSEAIEETKYASVFTCETKDQLNKNSSEIQKSRSNKLKLYQLTRKGRSEQKSQLLHKNPSEIEMYKCDVCDYETKRNSNLKSHELLHKVPSEIEMYKCESCTYETKYKRNLKGHRLMHKNPSEIKMYKCEFCSYETKWKQYLKNHQLIHKDSSDVRMYRCDACDYETKHKYALKSHQLMHKHPAEIQMYKCEFCTYKSKRRGNLRSHQLKHKNPSEIQMYRCDACGYETKYENVLKNHQLLHKDPCDIQMYKCDLCTYETIHKKSLKTHQLTHKDPSEMKMYKCIVCTYETHYKTCLQRHQLLHKDPSEMKMYKCIVCTYETHYKTCLQRHQLLHKDFSETQM